MAKAPKAEASPATDDHDAALLNYNVADFVAACAQLTSACSEYAGAQYSNPDADSVLYECQVAAASVMTSLQSAIARTTTRPQQPPGQSG